MRSPGYYFVNAITMYRLIAAPVLVILIFTGNIGLFKWLLAFSFFTDLIDGTLARKLHVSSVFGSKLDSMADDLTVLAGVVGLFVLKKEFLAENRIVVIVLAALLVIQNGLALLKYKKLSSFHTYPAKIAAVFQGVFLILVFFLPEPNYPLFYAAAIITALDLAEEIIMVLVIPEWKADVKGLYWYYKQKK